MKCGLLGQKLSHSYSPQIHSQLGAYSYSLFETEPDQLEAFLRCAEFDGLNITIPYKKAVIPFLDDLSDIARRLGAVNTVVRIDGKLIGHNTDYFGFRHLLQHSGLDPTGKKCLVCGSGGASNTVRYVLEELGAQVVIISRWGPNTYDNIGNHADAAILVNCTPVGMYPHVGDTGVLLSELPKLEGVLDLIYNPARTQLLLEAENRGIVTENGLRMLVAQAKESAEWFTGQPIADSVIDRIHQILRQQMENIILIGMPGSGKSTVGKLLADTLGKKFEDADPLIAKLAQKPIPQIFAEDGEQKFRKWEQLALRELGKESGLVIATGGGCVTRRENYPLLHQNGTIFWLQRNPEKLPTDGRPLSQEQGVAALYAQRKPLYESFADHAVDNNGAPVDAARAILSHLYFQEDTL